MIKLQVLISTHSAKGLEQVASQSLPPVDGVEYLVSCQSEPVDIPAALRRNDVKVVFTPSTGLSHNRNNALRCATAPVALIADNDLRFYPDGLKGVIEAFEAHPEVDIAAFRIDSRSPRVYPPAEHDLFEPYRNYWPCSAELAVRPGSLRDNGIWFNPEMGLGSPKMHSGEESLLLLVAKRRGLMGRFFPITVCEHPEASTGSARQSSPGVLRAEGAIIALTYPATALPRILLKAHRTRGNTARNALHLLKGAAYAAAHRRRLLK